jgi:hypothetical protein
MGAGTGAFFGMCSGELERSIVILTTPPKA